MKNRLCQKKDNVDQSLIELFLPEGDLKCSKVGLRALNPSQRT